MSTLAARLMADFDEEDEEDLPQQPQPKLPQIKQENSKFGSGSVKDEPGAEETKEGDGDANMDDGGEEEEEDDEEDEGVEPGKEFDMSTLPQATDDPLAPTFTSTTPIESISSLLHSEKLQKHLATIAEFRRASSAAEANAAAAASPALALVPTINKEQEYPYIVFSNELAFEIDSHIVALHKLARDLYAPRYSELEQLLSNPLEYARIASLIGNETDMAKVTKLLQGTGVANNILLTISVTATTTRGKPLPEADLSKLRTVCQTILDLDAAKSKIHAYISSRMQVVAPNVSAMLGPELAARLVALAGGIKKLSEIPACNLQVLGKKGKQQSGLSRIAQGAHEGLIVNAPALANCPNSLRTRALRLLANKLALAARQDAYADDGVTDDSVGRGLIQDVADKILKWQEAPAAKLHKALPIPLQKSKPHRGGKRYRKQKELMAQTEVAKQKSRLFFGKEAITDDYTGEDMGMLGQEGSGVLRIKNKDAKLAKRLSQKTQARLKRVGGTAAGVGGMITSLASISGTASSIAFTPAQGMQLVKTEQIQRVKAANDSYFSNTGSFAKVKKEGTATVTTASGNEGISLKRALPPVPTFSSAATEDRPMKIQKLG